jgi:glycosyltransferase involved in cell wall biosynthesis
MDDFRPRVLAILPGLIPSTMICVAKPFLQLHQAERIMAKITLESIVRPRSLKWADLVVFCRNTNRQYAPLLNFLINRKTPFIYDLDDNFFELPLDSEMGRYHRSPERLAMLTDYIQNASLVRVYSKPLLKKAKTLNPKVEQVIGPIDLKLISPSQTNQETKIVKLVYGTSRIQDELSILFAPALRRILKEYAGRVEAHFWGAVPAELKGIPNIFHHRIIRNYDRFLQRFSRAGFDIGLAPLPDDLFHRSKTNNKFREYGACRIAGIYSQVDVYSDCVLDGKTGLLVPNDPEAWYQAMVRLIGDQGLREKIKNQAQETVRQRYSQEIFEKVWWSHIQRVCSTKDKRIILNPPVNEIPQNPTPSSSDKLKNKMKRLRQNDLWTNLKMVQWRLFDYWMIVKIKFRLFISSRFNLFNRNLS